MSEANGGFDVAQLRRPEEDSGKWYELPGADGVRIKVRNIKPRERKKLTRECTKRRWNRRGGSYEEDLNTDKLSDRLLLLCVTDWEGIMEDGKKLAVTDENKMFLDNEWPEFNLLWATVVGDMQKLDDAMEAAERGN